MINDKISMASKIASKFLKDSLSKTADQPAPILAEKSEEVDSKEHQGLSDREIKALQEVLGMTPEQVKKDVSGLSVAERMTEISSPLIDPMQQLLNLLPPEKRKQMMETSMKKMAAAGESMEDRIRRIEKEYEEGARVPFSPSSKDVGGSPEDEEIKEDLDAPSSIELDDPEEDEDKKKERQEKEQEIDDLLEDMLPDDKIRDLVDQETAALAKRIASYAKSGANVQDLEDRVGDNLTQIRKILNSDPSFKFLSSAEKDLLLGSFIDYVEESLGHQSHGGLLRVYKSALDESNSDRAKEILNYRHDSDRVKALARLHLDQRHIQSLKSLKRAESRALRALPEDEYQKITELEQEAGLGESLATDDDFVDNKGKKLRSDEILNNLYQVISQYGEIWVETESAVKQLVTNNPQNIYPVKIIGAGDVSPIMKQLNDKLPKGKDGRNVYENAIIGHRFVLEVGASSVDSDGKSHGTSKYKLYPGVKYKLKKTNKNVTHANEQSMVYAIVDAAGDSAKFTEEIEDNFSREERLSQKAELGPGDFPVGGSFVTGQDGKDLPNYLKKGFLSFAWATWSKDAKKAANSIKAMHNQLYTLAGQAESDSTDIADTIGNARNLQKNPPKDAAEYVSLMESILPSGVKKENKEEYLESDVFDHKRFNTPIHFDEKFEEGSAMQSMILQYLTFKLMDNDEGKALEQARKQVIAPAQARGLVDADELDRREKIQKDFEKVDYQHRVVPELDKYQKIVDRITRDMPSIEQVSEELIAEAPRGDISSLNIQKAFLTKEFMSNLFSKILTFNNPIQHSMLVPMIRAEANNIIEEEPALKKAILEAVSKNDVVKEVTEILTDPSHTEDFAKVFSEIRDNYVGDEGVEDRRKKFLDRVKSLPEKRAELKEKAEEEIRSDENYEYLSDDPEALEKEIEKKVSEDLRKYLAGSMSSQSEKDYKMQTGSILSDLDIESIKDKAVNFSETISGNNLGDKGFELFKKYAPSLSIEGEELSSIDKGHPTFDKADKKTKKEYWKNHHNEAKNSGNGILHGLDSGLISSIYKDSASGILEGEDKSSYLAKAKKTLESEVKENNKNLNKKDLEDLINSTITTSAIEKRAYELAKRDSSTQLKRFLNALGGVESYLESVAKKYVLSREDAIQDFLKEHINDAEFRISVINERRETLNKTLDFLREKDRKIPARLVEENDELKKAMSEQAKIIKETKSRLKSDRKVTLENISEIVEGALEETIEKSGLSKTTSMSDLSKKFFNKKGRDEFMHAALDAIDKEISEDAEYYENLIKDWNEEAAYKRLEWLSQQSNKKKVDRARYLRHTDPNISTMEEASQAVLKEREKELEKYTKKGMDLEQAKASVMYDDYTKSLREIAANNPHHDPKSIRNISRFLEIDKDGIKKRSDGKGADALAVAKFSVDELKDLIKSVKDYGSRGSATAKQLDSALKKLEDAIDHVSKKDIDINDYLGDSLSLVPKKIQDYILEKAGPELEKEAQNRLRDQEMLDRGKFPSRGNKILRSELSQSTRAKLRRSTLQDAASALLSIFKDKKDFRTIDDLLNKVEESWKSQEQEVTEQAKTIADKTEKAVDIGN
jgi:REP element-mobilizing transposase RayT